MKIVICNKTGNVGKTTLAKNLFVQHLPGAKRIQIERSNSGDGKADAEVEINRIKQMAVELTATFDDEHYVVDLGSSSWPDVFPQLGELTTFCKSVDAWVVPCSTNVKQVDAIQTVRDLISIGIEPAKIFLLPNKVQNVVNYKEDFEQIYSLRELGVKVANQAVLASDLYNMTKDRNESAGELAVSRPAGLKEQFAEAKARKDRATMVEIAKIETMYDMSVSAAKNLESVFADFVDQLGLTVEA